MNPSDNDQLRLKNAELEKRLGEVEHILFHLLEHVSLFSAVIFPSGCPLCSTDDDEEELN